MPNKVLLMILDGYGLRDSIENNAVKLANTPNLDKFFKERPWTSLKCNGLAVGLPEGVMGNSEVGHLNIGAGRIVKQDLVRIDESFKKKTFKDNPVFRECVSKTRNGTGRIHLIGLLSEAGVHAQLSHLKQIILELKHENIREIYVHALLDGRDTPPNSGVNYVQEILDFMHKNQAGKLSTLIGRYYAMDRDKRWERVEKAYRMFTEGVGEHIKDPVAYLKGMYKNNITDEFMEPAVVEHKDSNGLILSNDTVLTFNYRADRMREIAIVLNDPGFHEFKTKKLNLNYVTMTRYQADFPYPVLFDKQKLSQIFGEIISVKGMKQLRIAETEKYAHVTYFFNGGEEKQFEGEERILIPSSKVSTYDLKPEMSAPEVSDKLIEAIKSKKYDVIILNYANGDMVGHTGVLQAAIKAMEYLDTRIGEIVDLFNTCGGTVFITADHGNCEEMWDKGNNQPHTQHSMNKVPFIIVEPVLKLYTFKNDGKLADIAPTMLKWLDISKPSEMDGESLVD
ncbi:MAG TPA: 2,3-bisphosphoglycerate-independent phosphoglycerate mutase [Candidatus Marinimicrobia bacterium]|nr:2,3-bisphosphoglycerate-independent phosphoglycerate mutase [Candidatus Neomarinimicrobiota bacterium]